MKLHVSMVKTKPPFYDATKVRFIDMPPDTISVSFEAEDAITHAGGVQATVDAAIKLLDRLGVPRTGTKDIYAEDNEEAAYQTNLVNQER